MAYTEQKATMAALAQAEKHKAKADRLEGAIAEHYKQVHGGNWGADDGLWETIGLVADVEVVG